MTRRSIQNCTTGLLRIHLPILGICTSVVAITVGGCGDTNKRPEALIQVSPEHRRLLADEGSWTSEGRRAFLDTQIELLKSPMIAERAAQQDDLGDLPPLRGNPDPGDWISKHLDVGVCAGELLAVSIRDVPDRTAAKKITNSVVHAYVEFYNGQQDRQRQRSLILARQEADRLSEELGRKRETLEEIQRSTGRYPPFDALVDPVVLLHDRYGAAILETIRNKARLEALSQQEIAEIQVDARELQDAIERDPIIVGCRGRLQEIAARLPGLEASEIDEDQAEALRLRRELKAMEDSLATRQIAVAPTVEAGLKQVALAERAEEVSQLEAAISAGQAEARILHAEEIEWFKDKRAVSFRGLDTDRAEREVAVTQELLKELEERIARFQVYAQHEELVRVLALAN